MLRQAENSVRIEGVLSEIKLKYGSYTKNGQTVETVGGLVKIKVDQEINGEEVSLEIPVHMFADKYTKKGTINPSFESIEEVMNEFVSIPIAATLGQEPDKVRIPRGNIRMNEYYGQDGRLISYPRIQAGFMYKATGLFKPEASFETEFLLTKMDFMVDKEGIELEPRKLQLTVALPQYGGRVDVVPFVAESPSVIDAITSYWQVGESYAAIGRLNFTSETYVEKVEVDFGEPKEKIRTKTLSELMITGGAQAPLNEALAFDPAEVREGLVQRTAYLEQQKQRGAAKKAPAPAGATSFGSNDLGF